MSIDEQLLKILRCPEDRSPLSIADSKLVAKLNRAIAAGQLRNVAQHPVKKPIDGGLVRQAGDRIYPIVDQIPVMLPGEAIELAQFSEET